MPIFDVNFKNQEAEKLFKRLNEATDATINYVKDNEPKLKKGLKGAAAAGGAGLLAKGISDARMNKYERDKLKAEKGYFDRMNKKLDDEDQYGRLKARLEKKSSAKDKMKNLMSISPDNMRTIKEVAKKIGMNAAGAGAVALGTKGGADLYNAVKNKMNNEEKEHWDKFIRRYPELKDKEHVNRENFRLFYESSPDLAKHPIAVKTFFKQIDTNLGSVNFNNLRDVSSIQDSFGRRDNGGEERVISGVNSLLHSAKDLTNEISEAPYQMIDKNLSVQERKARLAKSLKDSDMTLKEVNEFLKNN